MKWPLFAVLLLSLVLSACTTLRPNALLDRSDQPRQVADDLPQHWSLSGRIGVLDGKEGWHGKMDWRQDKKDFVIRILGPFGSEQAELRHINARLELHGANGRSISGPRLAQWERETFGAALPVEALPYWLHGRPAPGGQEQVKRDGKGQLSEMQQMGWQVVYSDWQKRGDVQMPGKLTLARNQVRIKLVINDYQRRG